jgi:flagellar protein FliS
MTQSNNAWQSYRRVAIQTASPGHLVLMLYDGAINFLERALTGFDYKDPAQRIQTINNNIIRAQNIIREMNVRLDMERGEDVAENLRKLYNYFINRLQHANFKKKREPIEEVLGHLREIRDGWAEMLAKGGASAVPETESSRLQPA